MLGLVYWATDVVVVEGILVTDCNCVTVVSVRRRERFLLVTYMLVTVTAAELGIVVLLHCGCLSLNPFIEFSIRNNASSSDVLNIQASISISPKFESKLKTTSHCHLLLHDCTNVAV